MKRDLPTIPLPRGWRRFVKIGLLHAIALQRLALAEVRSGFEHSLDPRAAVLADNDRLSERLEISEEENRILRARLESMPAPARPQYRPAERLAIVQLRGRTGYNAAETARRFVLTAPTVRNWMRRLDEEGPEAPLKTPEPVNRFDDVVSLLVQDLHATAPQLGRRKLAQVLGRAGLVLAESTVCRLLRRPTPARAPRPEPPAPKKVVAEQSKTVEPGKPARRVTARHPGHVWNCDLTTIATTPGFWVPWFPFSLILRWIFSWHIALVLDHFSRALVALAVFRQEPTAANICDLLDRAIEKAGSAPKHMVTDQGTQFQNEYLNWCKRHRVKPRFGKVGEHGSIAVLERFILSLKNECLRIILVPFSLVRMEAEVSAYQLWYNTVRSHDALGGRTPAEVMDGKAAPVATTPRLEPRARARIPPARGDPERPVRRVEGRLELVVSYVEGRKHLPVVELREAA